MKSLARLLGIAVLALVLLFFITNPEQLDKVWLWMIGFAGHIILLVEKGYKLLVGSLPDKEKTGNADRPSSLFPTVEKNEKASIENIEARLLRIENYLKTEGYGSNHAQENSI